MASVGLFGRHFGFTRHNPGIKIFRHAVALDERRIKFLPSLCRETRESRELQESGSKRRGTESVWFATRRRQASPSKPFKNEGRRDTQSSDAVATTNTQTSEDVVSPTLNHEDSPGNKNRVRNTMSSQFEVTVLTQAIQKKVRFVGEKQESSEDSPPGDGYREVWFAGCHSGESTTPFQTRTHDNVSRCWRWKGLGARFLQCFVE